MTVARKRVSAPQSVLKWGSQHCKGERVSGVVLMGEGLPEALVLLPWGEIVYLHDSPEVVATWAQSAWAMGTEIADDDWGEDSEEDPHA